MAPIDVVQRLAAMGSYGTAMQKLCDAEDWADPRFRLVVREALGIRPRIHARQWEDAAAFIGVADAGKLHPGSRGIGFGCGREPLTFALGARSGHLTVTDLYEAGTAWTVARTADPRAFVLGAAPAGFPAERLAVHHMDMRTITYPDQHFDFCYSISAFEHIGDEEDFLQHFREVRRVLKPDGVYALTTEVFLGETTRRTRGNYAFAVQDLLRLFADAGLQAAPEVDMRLSDFVENDPRILVSSRHDDPAEPMIQSLTLRDQAGFVSAPIMFVLRPMQGPPQPVRVIGREDTFRRSERARMLQRQKRFSSWVRLNPWGQRAAGTPPPVGPHRREPTKPDERIITTTYLEFGTAQMAWQVIVVPMPGAEPATVDLRLFSLRPGQPQERRLVHQAKLQVNATPGAAGIVQFEAPTEAGAVYTLIGKMLHGSAVIATIDVMARMLPVPPQPRAAAPAAQPAHA